jgi:hypothetical protein
MTKAGGSICVFATISCASADYAEGEDEFAVQERSLPAVVSPTYQAESATTKSGCSVDTKNAGFTGSGYIDFGGNSTWIEWNNIKVTSDGDYTLTFRYAVGSGSRPCAVLINGANAGNVPFKATGSWKKWETVSITKPLKAGNNTVRVLANTSSGGPNLDKMDLNKEGGPVVNDWQCNKSYYGTNDGCDCGCGAVDPDCNGGGCTGPGCKSSACKRYHALCPPGQECFLVTDAYGGKWKDVEKDPNTSHDNLFCWVAGAANILDWSGWGQVGTLNSTDDIFRKAQEYWPPDDDEGPYADGDDAYDFLEWFFVGDQSDTDYPTGGGFHSSFDSFPSYCSGDMSKPYVGLCPDKMASDSKAIAKLLKAGFAGAIQLKGDVGGNDGGHVITLWGYSVAPDRPDVMTGVFLTDSDDDKTLTNPPDRLFYRKVHWDGAWHILEEDGSPYKYIKYVYGLRRK